MMTIKKRATNKNLNLLSDLEKDSIKARIPMIIDMKYEAVISVITNRKAVKNRTSFFALLDPLKRAASDDNINAIA